MTPGIPPSPDRLAFRRQVIFATTGCILLAAVLLLAISGREWIDPSLSPERASEKGMGGETAAQRELASAFSAVKDLVLSRMNVSHVTDVSWKNRRHEGHAGWYKFDGDVDVTDTDGQIHPLAYEAVVVLDDTGNWKSEHITLVQNDLLKPKD